MRRVLRRTGRLAVAAALALAGLPGVASASTGPATPQRLYARNGATSITLSWTQPADGSRPAYFRVYENGAVVARNTTIHATLGNLVFNSTHTYTVTAVDRYGRESAPSAPITRTAIIGGPFGCGLTAPTGLAATGVTTSAVSLSWSNAQPYWDQPGTLLVLLDGAVVQQTTLDSARISGLAPSSTHSVQVARRDCNGTLHPSASLTVTTLSGGGARPTAPTGLTVGVRTNTSIALSWAPSIGADPAVRYQVYDGATPVAAGTGTGATVIGLWRDTSHQFTVSALDAAGGESAQSAPAATTTQTCDPSVPAPTGVTATALSASTVALRWVSTVEAAGFTVYAEPSGVVLATGPADSAIITGLPPAITRGYAVSAQTASCGSSAPGSTVTATTLAGPAARPTAPAGLTATVRQSGAYTGTATLSWTQPAGADPVTGYRLYEGAALFSTATGTSVTLTLPSGPTHTVIVVAVDAAGLESTAAGPVRFTVPFIPPP
jgi:chitodextrinase